MRAVVFLAGLMCSRSALPLPLNYFRIEPRRTSVSRRSLARILTGLILLSLGGCEDYKPAKGVYPTAGEAAWYVAKHASTGKKFSNQGLTCAMRKNDYGKYYRVCNTENGKCVVVRHNDFGPGKRLYTKGRIIDLSKAAFSKIADLKKGVIPVTIQETSSKAVSR